MWSTGWKAGDIQAGADTAFHRQNFFFLREASILLFKKNFLMKKIKTLMHTVYEAVIQLNISAGR